MQFTTPTLPSGTKSQDAVATLPVIDGLDTDMGLLRASNNHQLYWKLLNRFVEAYSDQQALNTELTSSAQARYLHTLKGVAGNLGATELHALCEKLESKPADSELMEQVITTTVELSQALAQSFDKSNPPADENTEQSQNIDSVSTSTNSALYKALLEAVANDDTEALTIVLNIENSAEIGLSASEFKKLENSLEEFDFDTASEVLRGSSLAAKT